MIHREDPPDFSPRPALARVLHAGHNSIHCVALTADAQRAVSDHYHGSICVWELGVQGAVKPRVLFGESGWHLRCRPV